MSSEFIKAINGPEVVEINYKVAKDWESLYEMIKGVSPEKSDEQIDIIEGVRNGKRPISDLHNISFDLQETVASLLADKTDADA